MPPERLYYRWPFVDVDQLTLAKQSDEEALLPLRS